LRNGVGEIKAKQPTVVDCGVNRSARINREIANSQSLLAQQAAIGFRPIEFPVLVCRYPNQSLSQGREQQVTLPFRKRIASTEFELGQRNA
jgi:hypothetical protein